MIFQMSFLSAKLHAPNSQWAHFSFHELTFVYSRWLAPLVDAFLTTVKTVKKIPFKKQAFENLSKIGSVMALQNQHWSIFQVTNFKYDFASPESVSFMIIQTYS